MSKLSDLTTKIRPSVVRVVVESEGNKISLGTGFYIDDKTVLTCAHVLMGPDDSRQIVQTLMQSNPGKDINSVAKKWLEDRKTQVSLELADGRKVGADIDLVSYEYDFGKLTSHEAGLPIPKQEEGVILGEDVCFWGFPVVAHIENAKTPFTVNAGFVSTIAETIVASHQKRNFIQVNAINLEGNSGGPLVHLETGKLVGMINGNMNRGRDDLAAIAVDPNGQPALGSISLRIPLGIAYATPIKDIISRF